MDIRLRTPEVLSRLRYRSARCLQFAYELTPSVRLHLTSSSRTRRASITPVHCSLIRSLRALNDSAGFQIPKSQGTRCMRSVHALLTCYFRDRRRQGVVRHFRRFGWVERAQTKHANVGHWSLLSFNPSHACHERLVQIYDYKIICQKSPLLARHENIWFAW